MIPGEILVAAGDLELNAGRPTLRLRVANAGDRPIQVGSHYHFFETNVALHFERAAARGFRLNIAAGTAVRFEPGQEREVELVALAGDRVVYGFNALVMGPLDAAPKKAQRGAAAAQAANKAAAAPRPVRAAGKRAGKAPAKRVRAGSRK